MSLEILADTALLKGKRIIVTGGVGGCGTAIVKEFVKQGATVFSIDIQDELGEAQAKEVSAMGPGTCTYAHCDIAFKDQVDRVFSEAERAMGGLDVLVNTAAKMGASKSALEFSMEEYDFIFDNDMRATILVNQAACRLMQKNNTGNIINFGSDSGITGVENDGLYVAAKAGVAAWTRTIAREWSRAFNIRCNTVLPAIKTPMYKAYCDQMSPEALEAFREKHKEWYPLKGDMGDAEDDLAPVLVYLASDMSQYINGQLYGMNGGMNMYRG